MTNKVPNIRFKGFTDDWEQRKLGEIADLYQPTTISSSELKKSGYPVFGANGYIGYYDKCNHNEDQVTISARGEGTGTPNFVVGPVWITGNSMVINVDKKGRNINKYFLFNNFLSSNFKRYITGGAQPQLTREVLTTVKFHLPALTEQTVIGDFFQTLDHLITLHQRKCEQTKELKKFMLQKMFPKKGEKNPEIRFPGFTDDWEQRKLGEVADIVGGGTPSTSKDEYWDGDIDWYAPAEILDQVFVSSSERKITQKGYDNSSTKMLPVGTVLFTSRAGIGKMAILNKEGCTNQGFQSIVPHANELDSYFIFSRASELKKYGETVGSGSTFVEVSGKQMSNMNLLLPKDINEQQKIGNYFQKIDHLITLHQRKCEQLKELKKFMLQNMFPKKG